MQYQFTQRGYITKICCQFYIEIAPTDMKVFVTHFNTLHQVVHLVKVIRKLKKKKKNVVPQRIMYNIIPTRTHYSARRTRLIPTLNNRVIIQ